MSNKQKISFSELSEITEISKKITFDTTRGFPKPTYMEGEFFYPMDKVCKFFKVESLDEPFIGIMAASKLLDMPWPLIQAWAHRNLLPSYSLKNIKGSKRMFRASELKKFQDEHMRYSVRSNPKFINLFMSHLELKKFFVQFLEAQGKNFLTGRELEIISDYLLDRLAVAEICRKYDLTPNRVKQIYDKGIGRLRKYMQDSHQKKIGEIARENIELRAQVLHLTEKINSLDVDFLRDAKDFPDLKIYKFWIDFAIKPIHQFENHGDLSIRALNALRRLEIFTFYELFRVHYTDRMRFTKARNVGDVTVREIEDFIREKNHNHAYINEAFFTEPQFEFIRDHIQFKLKTTKS